MSPFKVGLARGLCSSESGEESLDPTQRLLKAMLSPTPKTGRKWISEAEVQSLCNYYRGSSSEQQLRFLKDLAKEGSLDHESVIDAAKNLLTARQPSIYAKCKVISGRPSSKNHFNKKEDDYFDLQEKGEAAVSQAENRLSQRLTPNYQDLFTFISKLNGGVKFLVDLRADLLDHLSNAHGSADHNLKALNVTLKEMLSHWFSAGFLNLERVTWQSSCEMLEKVSAIEAVHPIRGWTDIKHRVGPYRRCFVFTHNSMPKEPVMVLHCALMMDIPESIQTIVQFQGRRLLNLSETWLDGEDHSQANAGIFYSISSAQKGLQGIELGNFLIKSVVKELRKEFRKMEVFSSLSPIPGFRDWLMSSINQEMRDPSNKELFSKEELQRIKKATDEDLEGLPLIKEILTTNSWSLSEDLKTLLKQPLMRLCARYLLTEKRRGYALNPVANFHLRNGAVLWRLNWMGDSSQRGLTASCGMMVNYKYNLDQTSANSKTYIETKKVIASSQVMLLTKTQVGGMKFSSKL
ncbi:putative malonyl-CoA decarboxylase, mitochondrial-like [Apostichopus japonicus]|uniref:Putative malonyl-CoA decarboxylase, mitochondrial-like n=1 Tax=Stichopus japonicus TaxID=307972 RepID=A0A2G8L9P7_STIJA|nr:putative malonyl-CoA decarboxylase, mitochondrial-like [Apostichopus japonicus]